MQERRRVTRTRVMTPAQIIFSDTSAFNCTVRDLTTLGAGLEANFVCSDGRIESVPFRFDLTFDGVRSVRACQLVWRISNKMGVKFVNGSSHN